MLKMSIMNIASMVIWKQLFSGAVEINSQVIPLVCRAGLMFCIMKKFEADFLSQNLHGRINTGCFTVQ